ncbi:MAG: phosphoheptose isomerase [candidate division Zixibacteria bacterium RBG_16_40_9]|nr:MAG: phosphoheptose isomerase [candidate division Zixibacteria bacterium RBG_16_40_9]
MSRQIDLVKRQLQDSINLKKEVQIKFGSDIVGVARVLSRSIQQGKKIFFCGNGGSAADAQHLAAELVVRLKKNSKRKALPALALSTNTSVLTACSNDFGFKQVYARQIEALGQRGDCLVAISTSGSSENVSLACRAAKRKGLKVISLLGDRGGNQSSLSDYKIIVPSSDTPRIQEVHITLGHIICELIERNLSK